MRRTAQRLRRAPPGWMLLALALLLSGCVTAWTRVDQPLLHGPDKRYSVEAPVGWVQFSLNQEGVTVTRDGLAIQYMEASLQPPDKVFKKTKKGVAAGALPAEVAALVLAELRAQAGLADLEALENTPATVAQRPGFRLRIGYRNERGAVFERLVLGSMQGTELLLFSYHALATHFYARDLPNFERFVASYKAAGKG